jgi:mRNA deadenylase 3'-5' endonuclease subunit Ccr4
MRIYERSAQRTHRLQLRLDACIRAQRRLEISIEVTVYVSNGRKSKLLTCSMLHASQKLFLWKLFFPRHPAISCNSDNVFCILCDIPAPVILNAFEDLQDDILMTGGRYAMDGCATFYRRTRFSLVKKYEVEFNKAAQSFVESIPNQMEKRKNEHRLMKPNVALIVVLEGLEPVSHCQQPNASNRSLVCVANTHIHANQDLPDVKLWQVCSFL